MNNNRDFWLPSEFLTPNDMLLGKENFHKNNTPYATNFGFPADFPNELGLSLLSESESDEDDVLTGFTRRFARSSLNDKALKIAQNLEKPRAVSAGSPQSTLSAAGCWPVSPSPPATPLGGYNDGWDLMYEAAGQLARVKMSNGEGLYADPSHPVRRNSNIGFYANSRPNHFGDLRKEEVLRQQCCSIWGGQMPSKQQGLQGSQVGLSESAWVQVQRQRQRQGQSESHPSLRPQGGSGMRAVFLGGSSGRKKRECAGTGVFLPRGYGTNNSPLECRKKPGCSTALLSASVVRALNNSISNFDNMALQSLAAQPQFNNAFGLEYDNLIARRNAMLNQQRWSIRAEGGMSSHDLCLPQEWMY